MEKTKPVKPKGSPVIRSASKVKKKYRRGFPCSPTRNTRAKKALFEVQTGKSINKTAAKYDLSFSFLQRRVSGKVSVQSRNGPKPFLSLDEENVIAHYVSEMALRGMGLGPSDILDLVQNFLKKEKRKNMFKDSRPSYAWYYGFMARHTDKLEKRKETLLEASRSKVTKDVVDKWFDQYTAFLSEQDMLDTPHRIFNADETGFTMGSKAGSVIGPCRQRYSGDIPHLSGGSIKQRLTVMYCANAEGAVLPPFCVYPGPKPTAYDPLNGATRGTVIHYTRKGWMDSNTFSAFIDHFDENVSKADRPVVLLIDSVSSHINMDIFTKAATKQIEIYRLVPNATHLLQPLDKGVFGPFKMEWYTTVRKNTRLNPDKPITKKNFAAKLNETYLSFYRPSIVIGAFKGSGIYPVCRQAISNDRLKPSKTFTVTDEDKEEEGPITSSNTEENRVPEKKSVAATEAFGMYSDAIGTPTRERYERRIEEGWDLETLSPGFSVYKKLKEKTHSSVLSVTSPIDTPKETASVSHDGQDMEQQTPNFGLDLLASAALESGPEERQNAGMISSPENTDSGVDVSPALLEVTRLPKATGTDAKCKPRKLLSSLPYSLTSAGAIREMALHKLDFARKKAEKERNARKRYSQKKAREGKSKSAVVTCTKRQSQVKVKCSARIAQATKRKNNKKAAAANSGTSETICPICSGSFEEENLLQVGTTWVECDSCQKWMHKDCIPIGYSDEMTFNPGTAAVDFICHLCATEASSCN